MPAVIGPVRPKVAGAFKVVAAADLGGLFVKSVTAAGLITYQDSSGDEQTAQLASASGGATVTVGTADPTGGSDGDAYIQVDGSDVIQSIWRNNSGTWEEYTVPAGGTGGGPDLSDDTPETVIGSGASSGTSDRRISQRPPARPRRWRCHAGRSSRTAPSTPRSSGDVTATDAEAGWMRSATGRSHGGRDPAAKLAYAAQAGGSRARHNQLAGVRRRLGWRSCHDCESGDRAHQDRVVCRRR